MQKILIDGYNVIHADEQLKKTAARQLEKARGALIEMIRAYAGRKKMQVTLVFDGAGGLTDTESIVPGKFQVLFSSRGQTADDLILKALRDSKNPREYIVVTSDMTDIGHSARGMGAKVLGSLEFLKRIKSGYKTRGAQDSGAGEGRQGPDADELDYWMDKFGGKNGDGGE